MSAWLEGPPKKKDLSDCAFMGDKILAKLFINTAVPSSAAAERFFSQGKDILKASLSDETFEMLMFLRGNKHHLKSRFLKSAVVMYFFPFFFSKNKGFFSSILPFIRFAIYKM